MPCLEKSGDSLLSSNAAPSTLRNKKTGEITEDNSVATNYIWVEDKGWKGNAKNMDAIVCETLTFPLYFDGTQIAWKYKINFCYSYN